MARVKRTYRSETRAAAAAATRESIVQAARALFGARGYGASSMDAVAGRAGVAVQTVYAVFGTKGALFEAVIDALDREADVGTLRAAFDGTDVTRQRLEMARFFGRLYSRSGDIIAAARSAGADNPGLLTFAKKGMARHRREMRGVAQTWGRAGALRKGVTVEEAADVLYAVAGYPVFADLRATGWSVRRYEVWLADAIGRVLFER